MAQRLPLVYQSDGTIGQLQPSDTLPSYASQPYFLKPMTSGASGTTAIGTPVIETAADKFGLGNGASKAGSKIVGLVFDQSIAASAIGNVLTGGILAATTAQWDAVVTGETGGLVVGTYYFLDPANAAKLTNVPPNTVAGLNGSGACLVYIGEAISPTELDVAIQLPGLL